MNIPRKHFLQHQKNGLIASKRSEDGMATLIFIALLAIMMILVTAESRALFRLHQGTRFLEQQQIKRLNNFQTNSVALQNLETK